MDDSLEAGVPVSGNTFLLLNDGPSSTAILPSRSHLSNLIAERRRASSFRLGVVDGNSNGNEHQDSGGGGGGGGSDATSIRRLERMSTVFNTPRMRSERLIGNSNPRYQWQRYWKSEAQLRGMPARLRAYYEKNNALIQQYIYIDRLLDSSLPADLLDEYASYDHRAEDVDEDGGASISSDGSSRALKKPVATPTKRVRTPRELYHLPPPDETDGLLATECIPDIPDDATISSGDRIVQFAIYINLFANLILLLGKLVVILLTDSLSVLASLVDAALDFLSTAIVFITTRLIARQDAYRYPVGRTSLEPLSIVVFATCMMVSFIQVALECVQRLSSGDHSVIELGLPAVLIMVSTVVIKGLCWFSCRLVKNSSVQALAQDAVTDVVFNTFSIIFPLVGFAFHLWALDAIGGLLLALYVIISWFSTARLHVENLSGASASATERNVLLYLTMRYATSIKRIQGLQAYHHGDRLLVEVDIVLDGEMPLRDSHDLAESLQYVLEALPNVQRAFVHADYGVVNLPSHLAQGSG